MSWWARFSKFHWIRSHFHSNTCLSSGLHFYGQKLSYLTYQKLYKKILKWIEVLLEEKVFEAKNLILFFFLILFLFFQTKNSFLFLLDEVDNLSTELIEMIDSTHFSETLFESNKVQKKACRDASNNYFISIQR